jgi:predicted transcriptional regulator
MKMTRAGDLMIPLEKYPHIPHWFTLKQAMVEMENSELDIAGKKSLPRVILVFDEKYQLVGLLRRRDILRGLEPEFLLEKPLEYRKKLFDVKVDPQLSEISYDHILEGVRSRANRTVSEVMIPVAGTADFNDHIVKVVYEMNANKFSLLPVLKDGRVVGVVRTVDVFREFAKMVLES